MRRVTRRGKTKDSSTQEEAKGGEEKQALRKAAASPG